MSRAKNGSSTKIGVVWQKSDFLAKNWNFGPKKRESLFSPNHVLPRKSWILGPKTAKFGPKLAFWAKYRHFWPTWSNAWPKNNADRLPKWFSVMLVPKLLLNPIKIRLFGPKTAKFGPKSAFLVILGQILPFFAHFVQWPTKNNMNKVPRWVFRYVGNKTFDFSSKKKDFLPKNDQIWPKTGIFGQFGPGLFSALLMGRLVVVARGLYLARHLFTLWILPILVNIRVGCPRNINTFNL